MALSHVYAATPRHPFPQHDHITYAPGSIRPNGPQRTQAIQDKDVLAFYKVWQAHYLARVNTGRHGVPQYRVTFGKPGTAGYKKTVSEGQGYGMVIVALLARPGSDAQAKFDGLWNFCVAHPSGIEHNLMAWSVPPDEMGSDSAFDGDCDIAYALLLADKQWGSGGKVNYRGAARRVIQAIYHRMIGPQSHLPLLGDWVNPIQGTPIDKPPGIANQYTVRTSDFMLDHFRAFARATHGREWQEVIAQCQATIANLQQRFSPRTGLLPDFIVPQEYPKPVPDSQRFVPKPAPSMFLEGSKQEPYDGDYYYNACRVPWRLGTDALLHADPVSHARTRKISHWAGATFSNPFKVNTGFYIRPGSSLDGKPLFKKTRFSTIFVAPLGVAAMTVPAQQLWLNKIYDAVHTRHEGYYEDSVNLLCLLVMTHNYWDPTTL